MMSLNPLETQKEVHIAGVGGPFVETTVTPPWDDTAAYVRLDYAANFRPDPRCLDAASLRLAALTVLLGFELGVAIGVNLPI